MQRDMRTYALDVKSNRAKRRCKIVTLEAKLLIARLGLLFASGPSEEEHATLHWVDGDILERDIVVATADLRERRSNALLDQMSFTLQELGVSDGESGPIYRSDRAVTKWLIYVDFSSLFNQGGLGKGAQNSGKSAYEKATALLVEKGFKVKETLEDGENRVERTWHYSVFDKSASQSREAVISFVADVGFDEAGDTPICILSADSPHAQNLNKRLCLGIDFPRLHAEHQCIVWSKYFAYRGLYLTAGSRIECSKFEHAGEMGRLACGLNEKTVLVLKTTGGCIDESETQKGVLQVIKRINRASGGENGEVEWSYDIARPSTEEGKNRIADFRRKVKLFDGEGLVSPRYAEIIRSELEAQGISACNARSFQVRMPFAKGVLHEVDFHQFLQRELGISGGFIEDAFGRMRNIEEVQIILTEEMFKCCAWLSAWVSEHEASDTDPMRYYFDKFREFNHGLYISNTDTGLEKTGITELNGQFLSTLCMTQGQFDELVRTRMNSVLEAMCDPAAARALLMSELPESVFQDGDSASSRADGADGREGDDELEFDTVKAGIDEEVEADDRADIGFGKELSTWQQALRKSERFIRDPFIKSEIEIVVNSKLIKCARGRLEAGGTVLFLSHDLLQLLVEVASGIKVSDKAVEEKIEAIRDKLLKPEEFYSSWIRYDAAIEGEAQGDRYYGVLRNPHLSRSEQCALKMHPDGTGLYERYFRNLTGVAMVSCRSAAPVVLGGADFDGDIVRVLWDSAVVEAILAGAYEKVDGSYRRRYAVVDMEARSIEEGAADKTGIEGEGKAHDELDVSCVRDHISYEQLKRTFSNRIGLISNAAMRRARDAYGAPASAQGGSLVIPEEDECAVYSVATGIDIDSVKTGEDVAGMLRSLDIYIRDPSDERERFGYLRFKDEVLPALSSSRESLLSKSFALVGLSNDMDYDRLKRDELVVVLNDRGRRTAFSARGYGQSGKVFFGGKPIANIDRLPWLLVDTIMRYKGSGKQAFLSSDGRGRKPTLFAFESGGKDWHEELNQGYLDQIGQALQSYRKVRESRRDFIAERERYENFNDFAKACRIVRSWPDAGVIERADADARLRLALRYIEDYARTSEQCDLSKILGKLNVGDYSEWAFVRPDKREEYLGEELMPGFAIPDSKAGDDFRKLVIENERKDGFMILFYLLMSAKRDEVLGREFNPSDLSDASSGMDEEFCRELVDITRRSLRERRSTTSWNRDAVEALRTRLEGILGLDGLPELVKYLRRLQLLPQKERFFADQAHEKGLFWSLLEWGDVEGYIQEEASLDASR